MTELDGEAAELLGKRRGRGDPGAGTADSGRDERKHQEHGRQPPRPEMSPKDHPGMRTRGEAPVK
ncbi:hypothetical protein [Faunimonas pinastri]|nr:hypothetical protein [Faunimonas pinastri]